MTARAMNNCFCPPPVIEIATEPWAFAARLFGYRMMTIVGTVEGFGAGVSGYGRRGLNACEPEVSIYCVSQRRDLDGLRKQTYVCWSMPRTEKIASCGKLPS